MLSFSYEDKNYMFVFSEYMNNRNILCIRYCNGWQLKQYSPNEWISTGSMQQDVCWTEKNHWYAWWSPWWHFYVLLYYLLYYLPCDSILRTAMSIMESPWWTWSCVTWCKMYTCVLLSLIIMWPIISKSIISGAM